MIIKDFDDMRIGTTPLSKLYYGHDLIWKREDVEPDSDTLIITIYVDRYDIVPYNTTDITGIIDFGDGRAIGTYDNKILRVEYPYVGFWEIKIKAPFTEIKTYAFQYSKLVKEVTFPKGVTAIGNSALYACSNLTSVKIPNSVTSIGSYAFADCSSLTSVKLSNSLTSIREYTFSKCTNLTSIIIPPSVKSIEYLAFYYTKLTSVTIAQDCTYVLGAFPSSCVINRY